MLKKIINWFKMKSPERLANRNHKRYTKWLTAHAPSYATGSIELKRYFTTTEGVNFYLPTDMLMLTMERKTRIEEAQAAFDYGMTKGELLETLSAILEQVKDLPFEFNQQKLKKFVSNAEPLLREAIYRTEHIKTEKVIFEISLLIWHIEGEDPYRINELTQKRKRDIAMADDELRAFFLQTTIALLKESTAKG